MHSGVEFFVAGGCYTGGPDESVINEIYESEYEKFCFPKRVMTFDNTELSYTVTFGTDSPLAREAASVTIQAVGMLSGKTKHAKTFRTMLTGGEVQDYLESGEFRNILSSLP